MSDTDRDTYTEHRPLNFLGMLDSQLQGLGFLAAFGFLIAVIVVGILWDMFKPGDGTYYQKDEDDDETIKNSTGGIAEGFWWGPSIGKSKGGLRRSSPGIGKSKRGGWRRPKWRWWW